MRSRKKSDVISTLNQKGFEQVEGDHHFYFLLIPDPNNPNNKIKTRIKTKISHGKPKDIDGNLMNRIREQLKFNNNQKQEAESFFDCPMSYDEYLVLLQENGVQF